MTINANRLNTLNWLRVGGLFAYIGTTTRTLSHLVALNPAITGAGGATLNLSRIIGVSITDISDAYAREDMALSGNGNTNPTLTTGSTAKDGESKTATELSDADFWISKGFSETVWDFTGLNIAGKVYPKLR
jgi:hypothetical protein